MKSLPILEALMILCLFAGLAYPLHRLTGQAPVPVEDAGTDAGTRTFVDGCVSLRFVHPPQSVRMTDPDGLVLLEWNNTDAETRRDAVLRMSLDGSEGADLRIEALWSEETPETAVEVRIEPDGAEAFVKSLWATGMLDAWLSIPIHE